MCRQEMRARIRPASGMGRTGQAELERCGAGQRAGHSEVKIPLGKESDPFSRVVVSLCLFCGAQLAGFVFTASSRSLVERGGDSSMQALERPCATVIFSEGIYPDCLTPPCWPSYLSPPFREVVRIALTCAPHRAPPSIWRSD